MKKFRSSLLLLIVFFLGSCKDASQSRQELEVLIDTFIEFYKVKPDSKILILSDFSEKSNIYKLMFFDLGNIEPPFNYLGLQTLKSNYKTHTVFYSSSSPNYLLSNQLNWNVFYIKKQNENKVLDENQPWYDFKELMFSYKKESDSIRVIPPIGDSFWVLFND